MNPRQITTSALAAALALGYGAPAALAHGVDEGKERCYGIAKAGQNDCGNLSGSHDCSGESAVDNDPGEWSSVAQGTCKQLKGMTTAEAKALAKAQAKAQPKADSKK